MTRWLGAKFRVGVRPLAVAGLLVLVACTGPLERELGVLNEDSESLMRVAANARNAGDPRAAIPIYQRAAKLSPESPAPLIALGQTLNELAAYDEAADAWTDALFLAPSNVTALTGYGVTLTGLNQPHLARAKYENALAVLADPEGVVAANFDVRVLRNGLGVVYDMIGEAGLAQASYRAGLAVDPNDLNLSNNLGLSLALSGQYSEAIAVLQRAADHPRAGAKHRLNLALAFGLAGQTEDAARIARLDLEEQLVLQNLSYYHVIRGLADHAERVAAVGSLRHQLALPEVVPRRNGPREVGLAVPAPPAPPSQDIAEAVPPPSGAALPVQGAPPGAPVVVAVVTPEPEDVAPAAGPAAEVAATAPAEAVWRVQLGSVPQLAAAEAEWARLQDKHRDQLAGREVHLQRVALDKGTYFRIQTGAFATQLDARALCETFRTREQSCLVVPPRHK